MSRPPRIEPSGAVIARVASTALALPDAYEEDAWTGVRGRVRNKTFAHVLVAQKGYTSAYRDMTGVTEPTTVLTSRSSGDELLALTLAGPPIYQPPWSPTVVGMVLDDDTDWDEVAELATELPVLRTPEAEAPAGSMTSCGPWVRNRDPGGVCAVCGLCRQSHPE